MHWLRSWWAKKFGVQRSSKEHEELTDYERKLIRLMGNCPDCGGRLLRGPEGGMSVNCCCAVCHSEFNITVIGDAVLGERISGAGPRDVGDRAWCYGL